MYPGPLKKGRAELNLCINRLKAINPTTIHSNDFLCTRVKEESMEKLGKKKKNYNEVSIHTSQNGHIQTH